MKKKILIFIPAYNVADHIVKTFSLIPFNLLNKIADISYLIIDDSSQDKTLQKIDWILSRYKKLNIVIKKNKNNIGYGGVQKYAFNYSIKNKFDACIMLHGDGQYHPKFLIKFILTFISLLKSSKKNLNITGIIFGSRMLKSKDAIIGGMPLYKFFGNKILTYLQNKLLSTKISEFHSGYRMYNVTALKKTNFNKLTDKFHFDTEIILECLKLNFIIREFPISTHYGNQVSNLKSIPYGIDVLIATLKFSFKKLFFTYRHQINI